MAFTAEQARQYRRTHPEKIRATKRLYRKRKKLGLVRPRRRKSS